MNAQAVKKTYNYICDCEENIQYDKKYASRGLFLSILRLIDRYPDRPHN